MLITAHCAIDGGKGAADSLNRCKKRCGAQALAPKWREIYLQNTWTLHSPNFAGVEDELRATMEQAKGVLESLGEEVEV